MINVDTKKIKQYVEVIPVLLFCFHLLAYLAYISTMFYNTEYLFSVGYTISKHLFECSLVPIILMGYVSHKDRWGFIPKICLCSITLLWLNNIPYTVFNIELNIYFFIFTSIIYVNCLILSLWFLTRR